MTDARDNIIDLFRKGIFPFKTKEEESKEESEENKLEKIEDDFKKFIKYIENESKQITMSCLKIILILWHLLFCQEHYMK